ncbi:hypothetical protein WR25_21728 [Diploscapter pachys]|uniref:Homeobox domain-containing protein n=1 Tax=Diploscapter pachys TaxID=2018661 RepID=A0A2A2M0X8_9BILA|nr:hypothetical protein WR25_21728 [Diploscapter pachys]
MHVLVNLENHPHLMGEIVSSLISKYGVPVSVVDSIDKICPKCSNKKEEESSEKNGHYSETSSLMGLITSPSPTPPRPSSAKNSQQAHRDQSATNSNCGSPTKKSINQLFPTQLDLLRGEVSSSNADVSASPTSTNTQAMVNAKSGKPSVVENLADAFNPFNPELLASFISGTPDIFTAANTLCNNSAAAAALNMFTADSSSNDDSQNGGIGPIKISDSARKDPNKANKYHITSSGKLRRGRIVYTPKELQILEDFYQENPNSCADPVKRKQMCELLSIDYQRLKVWFQNRRRKDKIRALQAAGDEQAMLAMFKSFKNDDGLMDGLMDGMDGDDMNGTGDGEGRDDEEEGEEPPSGTENAPSSLFDVLKMESRTD